MAAQPPNDLFVNSSAALNKSTCISELTLVSYNMHGFNQGSPFLRSVCDGDFQPDIIFIQ